MSREVKRPANGPVTDDEVKERIREFFDRNYELLRQEGGHVLAEGAKRQAFEQALLYWRKLKAIATSVTETEVKLALPGLKTPKGRPFVLEGVVDLVREGNKVQMYDLKTHEVSEVLAEKELYEDQLNVYAYIWKELRGQSLNRTAIIATRLPNKLREALRGGNPKPESKRWQPGIQSSTCRLTRTRSRARLRISAGALMLSRTASSSHGVPTSSASHSVLGERKTTGIGLLGEPIASRRSRRFAAVPATPASVALPFEPTKSSTVADEGSKSKSRRKMKRQNGSKSTGSRITLPNQRPHTAQ